MRFWTLAGAYCEYKWSIYDGFFWGFSHFFAPDTTGVFGSQGRDLPRGGGTFGAKMRGPPRLETADFRRSIFGGVAICFRIKYC